MALDHLHAGEQLGEVGANDLLDPDEGQFPAVAAAGRLLQGDQLGQGRGHLDAREVLLARFVANEHGEVETEVGNVGKGPAGIDRQRRQNGEQGLLKVAVGDVLLLLGQRLEIGDGKALGGQLGDQAAQAGIGVGEQLLNDGADGVKLARGRHAVGAGFLRARFDLIQQPSDADHEELVEVGAQDREELGAFEKRIGGILGLFENTALELEQAQLAVGIERRIVERDGCRRGNFPLCRQWHTVTSRVAESGRMRKPPGARRRQAGFESRLGIQLPILSGA